MAPLSSVGMSHHVLGHLQHKFVPAQMHIPVDHSYVRRALSRRDDPDAPGMVTPIMIVGIGLASLAVLVLGTALVIRQCRRRRRARETQAMARGVQLARSSVAHATTVQTTHLEKRESTTTDETHVAEFVDDKVRTSYESLDRDAFARPKRVSRARSLVGAPTSPMPARLRSAPRMPIDATGITPAPFRSTTVSSVHSFYGPAIARTRTQSDAQRAGPARESAIKALALAAGVAPAPVEQEATLELPPLQFSPFRESTFGSGMKLGEHLGLALDATPRGSVQSGRTNRWFVQDSIQVIKPSSPETRTEIQAPPRSAGGRASDAGTFGEPRRSYAAQAPYQVAHRHRSSSLSMSEVRSVRVSFASETPSPHSGVFPSPSFSHGRTQSIGSATQVTIKKIVTVFPPLLPDELVLAAGEKVTLLQTFDDEWCIVGRDRFGEAEVGAVPTFVFTKAAPGEKFARPMRSTSLGVHVEMSGAPTPVWSSREQVISWSNF